LVSFACQPRKVPTSQMTNPSIVKFSEDSGTMQEILVVSKNYLDKLFIKFTFKELHLIKHVHFACSLDETLPLIN
jgi:hypothetical protein